MLNYFTLGGKPSSDFGIYITGSGTYGAPEKLYTEYEVPGRNGVLLSSNHAFSNIEVVYPCAVFGEPETVRQKLSDFRSFLLSLDGYTRLTDTYHPDEFRMAVCRGPLEPEMSAPLDGANVDIVFYCKPQRFLASGDTYYSPFSGTVTGNPILVDGSLISAPNVVFNIDEPYSGKGSVAMEDVKFSWCDLLELYVNGETVFSMPFTSVKIVEGTINLHDGGTITKEAVDVPRSGWQKVSGYGSMYKLDVSGTAWGEGLSGENDVLACSFATLVPSSHTPKIVGQCWFDETDWCLYFIAPAQLKTLDAFEAFMAAKTVPPMLVIYPGYGRGVTWNRPDPVFPSEYCTITATSTTVSITIEADTTLYNPTLFNSQPLIRLYGNGTIDINGQRITVVNSASYVDIDCEAMDCYEGSVNRNGDVSFSTYDFPVLKTGENTFNVISGITGVVVTPRWWRL